MVLALRSGQPNYAMLHHQNEVHAQSTGCQYHVQFTVCGDEQQLCDMNEHAVSAGRATLMEH